MLAPGWSPLASHDISYTISRQNFCFALRVIAYAFIALAAYLFIQSSWVLVSGHRAAHSLAGIAWTANMLP